MNTTVLVYDLEALRIYLAAIGSVYPVAPEKAIATVDAAIVEISELRYRLATARNILEMIHAASNDAAARDAATSAIKAIQQP